MQQYTDGSFSEIQQSPIIFDKLMQDPKEMERTRAIFFGTPDELKAIKRAGGFPHDVVALATKVDGLEKRVNQVEADTGTGDRNRLLVVSDVKLGRNKPCYCGSGKKYKNCHGRN